MSEPDARTRILDAAEQAFAEHGLAGARVAAIAKDAKLNKAMLYYYFGSKQELYSAVLQRVFEQILAKAEAAGSLDPAVGTESLVGFVEGYSAVLEAHPSFVRLVLRGILDDRDALFAELRPRVGRLLPALSAKVAQGQAAGLLNREIEAALVPPALVAPILFFALVHPMLSQATAIPVPELSLRWKAHTRRLMLEGLLARQENP